MIVVCIAVLLSSILLGLSIWNTKHIIIRWSTMGMSGRENIGYNNGCEMV